MLTAEKILAMKRKMERLECEDVIVRFADHPSVHPDFRGKEFVATPFQREEEQPAWVYRPAPIALNFPAISQKLTKERLLFVWDTVKGLKPRVATRCLSLLAAVAKTALT